MNKKFIALAVAAAAFGTTAQAVELYNKDGSTFSIGGHATVGVAGGDQDHFAVDEKSPRINMEATQDLGNGFTADVKGEWALNMLNGGDTSFKTRLGYIGVSHDDYGRVAAGTQWSPYYSAAGIADMPIAFANDFLYNNHGAFGTGRADKMVAYTNGFDFANAGALNVGLGWQGSADITDAAGTKAGETADRGQVALGYDIAGFNVNYAYTGGDVTISGSTEKAQSHVVSAKYGTYGNGLFVAGVYAMNDYMNYDDAAKPGYGDLLEESRAYEAIVAYGLTNSLNLSVNYEAVTDEKKSDTVYATSAIQAEYDIHPRVRAFVAYQFDLQGTGDYKADKDNQYAAGVRFFL
ncbi:porin [Vibrio hangzhouensis]|uniref:Outer membrane protein (Porin) n=1 Tax=Vibrio hangzhouensis TaxID=462991 RepID=A0A1H5SW48_9VIBR|nr:porin [Vibrio hangzhouensis]SEF54694.1 Outer membrane protein (porin) [Vibrio hangzhouensis]